MCGFSKIYPVWRHTQHACAQILALYQKLLCHSPLQQLLSQGIAAISGCKTLYSADVIVLSRRTLPRSKILHAMLYESNPECCCFLFWHHLALAAYRAKSGGIAAFQALHEGRCFGLRGGRNSCAHNLKKAAPAHRQHAGRCSAGQYCCQQCRWA